MSVYAVQPSYVQGAARDPEPAPIQERRGVVILRSLFGDFISASLTLLLGALLIALAPKLLNWAVINGVWSGGGNECLDAGACWAFVRAKYPLILFGIYPPDQQWRPIIVIVIFLGLTLWSLPLRHWNARTLALWVIGMLAAMLLMGGGVFGLPEVPTASWGGLPITLLLTALSLGFGFPLGVALALGRQSQLPAIRYLSIGTIEIVRGLPLLSILFVASVLLPIMLPEGSNIDKLLRALVALTIFSAVYLAEVLRGGLQGIPRGQIEAARALGLSWLRMTQLIVLPQAIGKVIPPLTNTAVVIVKNTSLVLVIGLFDLLSSGRAALSDPTWPSPYAETYLLVALIYFIICFGISRYALWLEQHSPFGAQR
jgi:general L-amino acid transport system permease protein